MQTMGQIPPVYLATAAAVAARPVLSLSRQPEIVNHGDYAEIVLDPELQQQTADFILRQLAAEPGPVRIVGLGGVVLRVLARKYFGWIGGTVAGSFVLGRLTAAGGRK